MLLRFGRWLVVLALVLTIGGHWALLQSAAWVRMSVKFSQKEPISVALKKTFNGKFPCKLCRLVKAGQAAERKSDIQKLEVKIEFILVAGTCGLFPPQPVQHSLPRAESAAVRVEAPRPPPPRLA